MKHSDFEIGKYFTTAEGTILWKCTDIGTRTIVAIEIDVGADDDKYKGPPYSVVEVVFDTYDFPACEEKSI